MTQASVNGGMEILVEASINHDLSSGLIGTKILSFATNQQVAAAREYCRIKHRYTNQQIEMAINGEPTIKDSPAPKTSRSSTVRGSLSRPGNGARLTATVG